MKIVSSGKALHSPEFHQRRAKSRKIRLGIITTLIVSLLVGVVALLRMDQFLITEVMVSGDSAVREQEVADLTRQALAGYMWWLLPRNNALLYSRENVRTSILQAIPRIQDVDLRLADPRTLEVKIVERIPHALYCIDAESSACFFLDESGYIFAHAPSFSGDVYFTYTTSDVLEIGGHVLPVDRMSVIRGIVHDLTKLGLESEGLHIDTSTALRTKYELELDTGGEIWWNDHQNLDLVFSNLETFILSDIVQKNPSFIHDLLYIDLRTDNKVFYKFK